jgi:hypothetical protein
MRRSAFLLLIAALGCSASKESSQGTPSLDGSIGGDAADDSFNLGDGLSPDGTIELPAKLHGKVVAPEGTIPISGALVYTSTSAPPAIPDHVYCDKCVKLTDGTPYATTAPDGTFTLPTFLGEQYLIVQKGAFRRVRKITAVTGDQDVPKAFTTMPPKTDKAAGDDVPKMAVMLGAWDPIEMVLARMGLAATVTKGGFPIPKPRILSKDAVGFAIYGLHDVGESAPHPDGMKLITDPAEISQYHIVFIPCTGSSNLDSDPKCSGVYAGGAAKGTIDGFVKAGGRIYVSDWSYEYVNQIFPGFVSFKGETSTIGSACTGGGGDQTAKVDDTGLTDWLKAQGKTLDTVKDAWTYISSVNPTKDVDPDGKMVTTTPKVWVEAAGQPASTSFEHACGRVLYTTYHTQPTAEAAPRTRTRPSRSST